MAGSFLFSRAYYIVLLILNDGNTTYYTTRLSGTRETLALQGLSATMGHFPLCSIRGVLRVFSHDICLADKFMDISD